MDPVVEPNMVIPASLLPRDGRFGSGPAKIRAQAAHKLATSPLLGTSHRQEPVKALVRHIRAGLAELYTLPEGYQVVLGNGGATYFWDTAVCSLIERRSAHGVYGEFTRKFARAAQTAPFLQPPYVDEAPAGGMQLPGVRADADVYAWAQNETSTGVAAPVRRPDGADADALVVIDATSAAGGMAADVSQCDAYYFAPQKNFSSDGGLWLALCSPAALTRAARLTTGARWVPDSLNLTLAAQHSAQDETLNTPAIATLVLLGDQLDWLLDNGGLDFARARTAASSKQLYEWAEHHPLARPFVADPTLRSPVVVTIDFDDAIDAKLLTRLLRANGVVDVEPYRKLGRNQIRVGVYASVDPADVSALIACLDWLLDRLTD